ncbi:MAG TPA: hypothetical protein DHL02_07100 [Achromobacter sp.]|nr:hypothetical protein [Achromobacter sp.]
MNTEWKPIASAPKGQLVMVYTPPQPSDWPDTVRIGFDFIDSEIADDYWYNHGEHYEHYCCVAKPENCTGPQECAPYTHWMPLPAAPCMTCNGHGMIGGPSFYAPDEGGEPCPDCSPPAPTSHPIPTGATGDRDWELACDECNGSGHVFVKHQVAERKTDVQEFKEECEACEGRGFNIAFEDIPGIAEYVKSCRPAATVATGADGRSATYGMTLGERIAHVGGRTNAQSYTEFGSPMAVNALIQHVLRDLDWTRQDDDDGGYQARYRLPGGEWSSWGHVVCGVKGHEQELRYLPGERRPAPAAGDALGETVTILPDGSAFAVASFPLPADHWLYAEREYETGAEEPKELPAPILTHEQREAVVAAIRYAVRGATMCGKELDFDPDALVQNAVYALCGPYTAAIAQQKGEA